MNNGLFGSGLGGSYLMEPQTIFGSGAALAAMPPGGVIRITDAPRISGMNEQDFQRFAAMQEAQMGPQELLFGVPPSAKTATQVQCEPKRETVECTVIDDPLPQSRHLLYGGSREEN